MKNLLQGNKISTKNERKVKKLKLKTRNYEIKYYKIKDLKMNGREIIYATNDFS